MCDALHRPRGLPVKASGEMATADPAAAWPAAPAGPLAQVGAALAARTNLDVPAVVRGFPQWPEMHLTQTPNGDTDILQVLGARGT